MNPNAQFERDLEQWLHAEAPASAPAGFHATVMDRARTLRQRPGWTTTLPARRFGRGRGITLFAVAALLLVGGALAAGSGVLRRPSIVPPVTAPSFGPVAIASPDARSPNPSDLARPSARPTPTAPRLFPGATKTSRTDLCPGATQLADIWDTSVAGNTMNNWVHGSVDPLDAVGSGAVAIVVPVPGGPTEVRVLNPLTSRSCLLVELPDSVTANAVWSPSGDALAIAASDGSLYVWSAIGTTRPMVPSTDTMSWSPDGSELAIGSDTGMWILPSNGATAVKLHCDPPGPNPECPAFPRLLWSPSGDRLVMAGGDRMDSSNYGPASMVDPVFHQIAPVPALEGAMPIGWLDSQTLVEASDSRLFEVPVDDRTQFRQLPPGVSEGSEAVFSPDQRLAAFGSFRQPVRILDVATGREKVVIGATQLGPDVDYSLVWSSDDRSLVVVADRSLVDSQGFGYRTTLGLWVMNADGSGLRKLMNGQVGLVSTEDTDAQRSALQSNWARALEGPAGSPGTP